MVAVRVLGIHIRTLDVRKLFNHFDEDGNGTVNLDEFCTAIYGSTVGHDYARTGASAGPDCADASDGKRQPHSKLFKTALRATSTVDKLRAETHKLRAETKGCPQVGATATVEKLREEALKASASLEAVHDGLPRKVRISSSSADAAPFGGTPLQGVALEARVGNLETSVERVTQLLEALARDSSRRFHSLEGGVERIQQLLVADSGGSTRTLPMGTLSSGALASARPVASKPTTVHVDCEICG